MSRTTIVRIGNVMAMYPAETYIIPGKMRKKKGIVIANPTTANIAGLCRRKCCNKNYNKNKFSHLYEFQTRRSLLQFSLLMRCIMSWADFYQSLGSRTIRSLMHMANPSFHKNVINRKSRDKTCYQSKHHSNPENAITKMSIHYPRCINLYNYFKCLHHHNA